VNGIAWSPDDRLIIFEREELEESHILLLNGLTCGTR